MIVRFDPRTKIICILFVVICSVIMPSLEIEAGLMIFLALFGVLNGQWKKSVNLLLVYFLVYGLWNYSMSTEKTLASTSIIAWLGLVFKLFPCCLISSIVVKSTHISEFLTAMTKSHIPKTITIPMAVLFRYVPTVREDWAYIKDAMVLRGVNPTIVGFIKNPVTIVECLYVPLLITASKTADDLSIASVTRGIENPAMRTSIRDLRLRYYDFIAMGLFVGVTVTIFLIGAHG